MKAFLRKEDGTLEPVELPEGCIIGVIIDEDNDVPHSACFYIYDPVKENDILQINVCPEIVMNKPIIYNTAKEEGQV